VLVLGASVSGDAAVRLATELGHDVRVYDVDPARVSPHAAAGRDVASGDPVPSLFEGVDVVVTSPGVPEGSDAVQLALRSGCELWSEIEFAARHTTGRYAAITGTNGKSTATVAAADMLRASGVSARAVGNVGIAMSDAARSGDTLVVETSSFQLRFIDTFHPAAASILNIAPDHLDWHGTMEAYVSAKARITENQRAADLLVIDPDDLFSQTAVTATHARVVHASGHRRPPGGNGPDGDVLFIDGYELPRPDLDPSYLYDLIVAGTVALHMGGRPEGVAAVIDTFQPGSHRRQIVGAWEGIAWVDDSKATNPHAAAAAVAAYPSVVLIAGGRNKGLDLSPIATVPSLRHVVAIGEAREELAALIPPSAFTPADSMAAAVAIAAAEAESGDTVLLAPACASFDMFDDYGARGDAFAAEARRVNEQTRGGE
jgi:UDP-N-acetylmuramoylalanine--D-glutamate ligase